MNRMNANGWPSVGHVRGGFTGASCAVGGGALVQCPESLSLEVPPTGTWPTLGRPECPVSLKERSPRPASWRWARSPLSLEWLLTGWYSLQVLYSSSSSLSPLLLWLPPRLPLYYTPSKGVTEARKGGKVKSVHLIDNQQLV